MSTRSLEQFRLDCAVMESSSFSSDMCMRKSAKFLPSQEAVGLCGDMLQIWWKSPWEITWHVQMTKAQQTSDSNLLLRNFGCWCFELFWCFDKTDVFFRSKNIVQALILGMLVASFVCLGGVFQQHHRCSHRRFLSICLLHHEDPSPCLVPRSVNFMTSGAGSLFFYWPIGLSIRSIGSWSSLSLTQCFPLMACIGTWQVSKIEAGLREHW